MVELDTLKRMLSKNSRRNITQSTVDTINNLTTKDGEQFTEAYRENFVGYLSVLKSGEYKISDYMNAVRYVSYKLMEYSNIDAYCLTFPDRYSKLLEQYKSIGNEKKIREVKVSSYVSMYNKNKLVNAILDQSMIPSSVINNSVYQEAVNTQRVLMLTAKSELVKTQAANSLLIHLKPLETAKIELDIGFKKDDVIEDYEKAMRAMVQKQKELIAAGADVKTIANAKIRIEEIEEVEIIEGEIENVSSNL